jgi:D-sedoheptulose 7-phosphate isomerase
MMQEYFKQSFDESIRIKQHMLDSAGDTICAIAEKVAQALGRDSCLYFAGNGGSAADSQHLATELVVRLSSDLDRRALPGLALTTDTSLITACSNDYSFDRIYARQIEALGREGDCLLLLSTSGNSQNLCEAAKTAADNNIHTIGFLGGDGGRLLEMLDQSIIVPSVNPGRVQECHITLGHVLIGLVERHLFQ